MQCPLCGLCSQKYVRLVSNPRMLGFKRRISCLRLKGITENKLVSDRIVLHMSSMQLRNSESIIVADHASF